MKISFDLDDTLIPLSEHAPVDETIAPRQTTSGKAEFLRHGTRELLQTLHQQGWVIVIYTASTRGTNELINWFHDCDLPIFEIISPMNETRELLIPTKYPPAYGIHLHIDDCPKIAADGKHHGFEVLRISPNDTDWAIKVLQAATTIHLSSQASSSQSSPPI